MVDPSWINDPYEADWLRDAGQHYDRYELAEANGREETMGLASFEKYEKGESRFMSVAEIVEACKSRNVSPMSFRKELIIKFFEEEEMKNLQTGDPEMKLAVYFDGVDKGLILSKTNVMVLKDIGGTPDGCVGSKVELYLDSCQVGDTGYMFKLRPAGATTEADEIPF